MFRMSGFVAALTGAWLCFPPSPAQAEVLITIDKASQQMTVAVDGAKRWVWPVSTGRRSYETPAGNFQPFRMAAEHYSKEWDDAPMPHSIFFTEQGHAIHGSFETSRLGSRASHGCVRLSTKNAARLYALVQRDGLANAKVVVLADPTTPVMAKRKAPAAVQQARRLPAPTTVPEAGTEAFSYAPARNAFGYAPAPPMAVPRQPAFAFPYVPAPESRVLPYRVN